MLGPRHLQTATGAAQSKSGGRSLFDTGRSVHRSSRIEPAWKSPGQRGWTGDPADQSRWCPVSRCHIPGPRPSCLNSVSSVCKPPQPAELPSSLAAVSALWAQSHHTTFCLSLRGLGTPPMPPRCRTVAPEPQPIRLHSPI